MSFYPKAESTVTVAKADKAVFAAEIIKQLDTRNIKITDDNAKAQIIGDVLKGSPDLATFNEAWAEVAKEYSALMSVSGKDATEYASEVAKVAVYADKAKWCTEAEKAGLIGAKVIEVEKA